MKKASKITKYAGLAFLSIFSLGACTADHAYKTTITPEDHIEPTVKSYESDFFREVEKNSIISVQLNPDKDFDQFKFMNELESIQGWNEEYKDYAPLMLIGDSQNRIMRNPWISLNDSISYRITHYVIADQLHLKANYIIRNEDDRKSEKFRSGNIVSRETAAEAGLMPVWEKMISLASQYGDDITIE
ncbi:hypothetical protein [Anditalea andensis]|uniref:Lipoprotein n=1 Tax=Anditalea andensis TaxID=1048983 RepID=A0A074L7Q4_9BACT|nr:hypothetical protein [Anditalea andensis]KEO75888.1 hypothetical protein EL17_22990 [Anditalea andensis]